MHAPGQAGAFANILKLLKLDLAVHDVRAPEVDAETKRIKDAAKGEDLGPEVRKEPVAWMQLESTSCEGSLCSGKQIRARIRF